MKQKIKNILSNLNTNFKYLEKENIFNENK